MNLLTPSSSSTLTLDPSKGATAGYLTTIFRRILCSGGLPTHPLDQISERDSKSKMSGKVQEFKPKQSTQSTTTSTITPGIVERLMGLEPMGERETKTSIEATPSSSLSRSKSMNSVVEHLGECKRMEGLHKHAKSSSFHEVSTFYLHENENFLVLSFKSGCDDGVEFRSKGRKKEKGLKERGEFKKNKRENVHDEKVNLSDMSSANVGNDGCQHKLQFANTSPLFMGLFEKENVDSETKRFSHSMKSKEVTNGAKVKRRKKGTTCYAEKKVDTECNSEEDSSPVSIFDFERQTPRTEVDSFGVDTSWRRKLSSELENEQLYCDNNMVNEEMKVNTIENNKHEGSKRKEKQSHECADIWVEICRLVDDELGSNKFDEGLRKQGNFESVCVDFESEIFDHLLYEVIDQLVGKAL
ncbi:uncharacterized protein LOC109787873 [Cajanus cajan]|uniref:uncharacterized protein LOC109787873 n=1 Tax=Cajanus cajan TaxID=3821 RepID=UPI00098DA30F|nr:uncharacterized protein LOC109787873 [Cajanus cajan]